MGVDRPEFRLSDAERQEALDALSEHVRTGRLDIVDFDERSARASAAKVRRDLEPLFADLPEPRPSVLRTLRRLPPQGAAPAPPVTWQRRLASSAVPIAAIVALVLFLTVLRGMIFVFLIPVVVALLAGSLGNRRPRR
ncbi:uncharacterized protein DUF1707 [Prauserella shujinwangii]|uniref:Uncharacterized protein DUF1707 n=1 Tax=Prauserella shujinwangii TaxID=1453103 RepID=A0A2T0LMN2_9PSEU|nr:DUF1707 domain-containing protein [Prauserella shujinwangii]PRX44338.1 uncharacterized protein DUF1707 [Prauserella shujinwangii]